MKNLIEKMTACESNQSTTTISSALIAAATILIVSWLTRDSANAEIIFLITLVSASTLFLFNTQKDEDNTD